MAKEICISVTPHETRLAILEDDQLAEIYYERENEYTLAGSIYKGRVTRVLPGMQSSFVDVGLERDAFLYVTDFLEDQEDSDEYTTESQGSRGEPRSPHNEVADEPHSADLIVQERGGSERSAERHAERSSERNSERSHERNPDRGPERQPERSGRRPAAMQQAEPAREGGRAGRERAREQAIAPLREAVPAAQDLEEKGDEESPEGTRRWRGRRGRRRGVRAGLPQAGGRSQSTEAQQTPEEHEPVNETLAAPVSVAEHGAPGGVAMLHASPATRHSGRERGSRRTREAYAQASTLDRSPAIAADPLDRGGEDDRPAQESSPLARAGTPSVLPGESLSKYGGVPAAPGSLSAQTATAPKTVAAINYVAPKPATLVEVAEDWDGGAVLPGETISRYRAPSPAPAATGPDAQMTSQAPAEGVPQDAPEPRRGLGDYAKEGETAAAMEPPSMPGGIDMETPAGEIYSPFHEELTVEEHSVHEPAAGSLADGELIPAERVEDGPVFSFSEQEPVAAASTAELQDEPREPAAPEIAREAGEAKLPDKGGSGALAVEQAAVHEAAIAAPSGLTPAAEPEFIMAALSPDQEARDREAATARIATPELTHSSEPVEYEPESASASYRVPPTGASELRVPGPETEEEESGLAFDETQAFRDFAPEIHSTTQGEQSLSPAEFSESMAEPAGQMAGSHVSFEPRIDLLPPNPDEPQVVPEFSGSLSAAAQPEPAHVEAPPSRPPMLQILHADGSVDLAVAPAYAALNTFDEEAAQHHVPEVSLEEPGLAPEPMREAADSFALPEQPESGPLGIPSSALASTEFSDLVDRLQGFAPGQGLLEEETIDEEEYDFEPMHAHAEDGDQEDLEEETLDHHMEPSALSDAVRDSYLEQRVQQAPHAQASALEPALEEEESTLGFEEVDDEQEDFEDDAEGDEALPEAQSSEPQRQARPGEGRGRGRQEGRGSRTGSRSGGRSGGRGRSAQTQDLPIISELLKQGQEILVQIAKEPIAKKGARITSHIALPGRFLVFMPTVHHVGVSRKIASDEERQRLKRILISEKGESSGGFIVRTAAEGASEEDLRADLRFLISLWTEIKQRSESAKAPALIYHDLNLVERILRDQVSSNFATIWVDSEAEYERITRFLHRFQPGLVRRVKLYTKETPLFEHFGIQEEISKALKSKVWLKSGGSIVINQTEALVAIDINTGKYVGKTSRLEDTIVKTNLDAIPEIVRQIRLRDLGGIIVIDFIDMDERKNRNKVLAALEEELKNDRAPSKVLQFNDFGLVAITRKRVKQSLERTLSVTCETCTGTGMVKSPITVCNEIYTEMRKMQKHLDGKDVLLRVHPEVVKQLKANNAKWINELEEMVTKTIIIKSDPTLHPEQFDIH